MKFSMGSWAFSFGPFASHPIPLLEVAKALSSAGYDGIELGGYPPHVTLETYATKESRQDLKRTLDGLGLAVSGYAADFLIVNPTAPDHHNDYVDLFRRQLELAADVGSPALRVDTGGAPGSIEDADYHTTFHRLADTWRRCADYARQAQVKMVWEFEPGFVFNKPSEVVDMHDKVGHPWFQILFDTAHAYTCSVVGARQHGKQEVLEDGVEGFLDKLHGRVGALHLDDSDGSLYGDETSLHLPFGRGHIHFELLAPKLKAQPHLDWCCVDLCYCAESWDNIAPGLEFARNLLG
jgi:sugar phosphate isomerase/epimerase